MPCSEQAHVSRPFPAAVGILFCALSAACATSTDEAWDAWDAIRHALPSTVEIEESGEVMVLLQKQASEVRAKKSTEQAMQQVVQQSAQQAGTKKTRLRSVETAADIVARQGQVERFYVPKPSMSNASSFEQHRRQAELPEGQEQEYQKPMLIAVGSVFGIAVAVSCCSSNCLVRKRSSKDRRPAAAGSLLEDAGSSSAKDGRGIPSISDQFKALRAASRGEPLPPRVASAAAAATVEADNCLDPHCQSEVWSTASHRSDHSHSSTGAAYLVDQDVSSDGESDLGENLSSGSSSQAADEYCDIESIEGGHFPEDIDRTPKPQTDDLVTDFVDSDLVTFNSSSHLPLHAIDEEEEELHAEELRAEEPQAHPVFADNMSACNFSVSNLSVGFGSVMSEGFHSCPPSEADLQSPRGSICSEAP